MNDCSNVERIFHKSFKLPTSTKLTITFYVEIAERLVNYHWESLDDLWTREMWEMTKANQWIDVSFKVQNSLFSAYLLILGSRSRVFAALFERKGFNGQPLRLMTFPLLFSNSFFISFSDFIHFNISFSFSFIFFILSYSTGTLKESANNPSFLAAAEKYGIETLRDLCSTFLSFLDVIPL